MQRTSIEWVKNPDGSQGFTFNPITGCLNHTPEGLCLGGMFPCYARRLANGRLRSRYLANSNLPTHDEPDHEAHHSDPFYPRFWPDRLKDIDRPSPPSAWANNAPMDRPWEFQTFINRHAKRKARGIFTCDMADLFGIGVPEKWTREVLEAIRYNSIDRFYLLTKQPQNLAKFSPFPENCWVGVTVTADGDMTKAYYGLSNIEAKVKYISCEPLLGAITMKSHRILKEVDWVIIGAQTKPYKPPKTEWVQEIVEACDKTKIPVFIKNNLAPYARNLSLYPDMKVGDKGYNEIRQEMPE